MRTSLALAFLCGLTLTTVFARTSKPKSSTTHVRQTMTKSGKTIRAYDRAASGTAKSINTRAKAPRAHTRRSTH